MLSDYSQLIENIVINISSLFGVVFQVQYLNEESTWITLSETVADIQDMFRCSQIVNGAEFKRIKIRIVEGCSPAINSNKHSNEDVTTDTSEITKNPKRLRFSEEENDRGGLGSYKTPIELDIQKKQTDISHLESELSYYEEQYDMVSAKYAVGNARGSKLGSKQCGKCHLFQNHRKTNCPNDFCISAQMCGDVSKHADETSELREIESRKQKINSELRKERLLLETQIKCAEKVNSTFSKRMEAHLIESDRKQYLVCTTFGIKPRQALINEHVSILEKHYRGKMPSDVEYEKTLFTSIIKTAMFTVPKQDDSVKDLLKTNAVHPVKFPGLSATPSKPQSPPLPPPLPPSDYPMSPYGQYGWYGYPGYGFYQPWSSETDCGSKQIDDENQ